MAKERRYRLSIQYNNEHDAVSTVFDYPVYGYSIPDVLAGLFGLKKIWEYIPEGARIIMIKLEDADV